MDAGAQTDRRKAPLEIAALLLILGAAGGLRFPGITHHVVRGWPDFDEQNNFVRPILRMWREGTLDPTVYQGYAGFFNWLAAVPVWLGDRLADVPGAYGAARGVVAAFGLLNVLLVGALARRLAGPWAGLFAAALLAVSRLDVRAAHHVTPDVLVASAVLGVLYLVARPSPRGDLLCGVCIGLAAAVKYTGLFAGVPAALAALAEAGSPRAFVRRGLRLAAAAALSFVVAAPYAVVELAQRGRDVSGLVHYYGEKAERNRDAKGGASGFQGASGWLLQGVGPIGAGLALAGLLLGRDRRRLVPAAGTVAAGFMAMSAAAYIFPRHVVPPAAALTALAGVGFAALASRTGRAGPWIAVLLAAASLPLQARASIRLTRHYLEPSAVDRAAAWIEASGPREGLVAASLPRLAIDPGRFEVRRVEALDAVEREVLGQFDLLVSGGTDEVRGLAGFKVLAEFPNEDRLKGLTVTVLAPPESERQGLRRLAPHTFAASANATDAGLAADGDPDTSWRAPAGEGFLDLRLDPAASVFRVEVDVGTEADAWPQDLRLEGRESEGAGWTSLATRTLRPSTEERQRRGAARGQVFVVNQPRQLTALRVARLAGRAWSLSEVRVFARSDGDLR